ncbi:sensor histidine kinase [Roseinatronobacter alkalisoli]|uniref:sensor histidine kinase n=1 Tax=Roseinatronobacter alkalisoli TaxID=3028235 RepID=UPI002367AFF5|nr:sensor histidine kinase [Roseinatronobacter sp. HJB301]
MAIFDISDRLATRLAILMTLALAPLGAISIYSEYQSLRAQARSNDAMLIRRTIDAVAGQRGLLESAMLSAHRLTPLVLEQLDDSAACSDFLREFVSAADLFAFAGFVPRDGTMTCASQGEPVDFSNSERMQSSMANARSFFSFQPNGAITGRPVVVASRPVFVDGALLGYMSISVSQHTFALIAAELDQQSGLRATYLVNPAGETLTSADIPDAAERLPGRSELLSILAQRNGVFREVSEDGERRMFTLAELIPGQLYALGSWSTDQWPSGAVINFWRLSFPVLMWFASLAVVMFAVDYMVVRHLKRLNSQLRRFALGNRAEFQRLPERAPSELREIDSTFSKMALLIRRDEREREEALTEKTILLKEIHHRVKNNLQLIGSILNLQMRRLQDREARSILKGVQSRVRSLATIHRTLYEQDRISERYAASFFDSILQETLSIASTDSTDMQITKQFDAVDLPHHKIIPASLLFAEALTNALKYAMAPAGAQGTQLDIRLTSIDRVAELTVWNSVSDTCSEQMDNGLGQELMTAFALQIHGDIEIGPAQRDGVPGWQVRLRIAEQTPSQPAAVA